MTIHCEICGVELGTDDVTDVYIDDDILYVDYTCPNDNCGDSDHVMIDKERLIQILVRSETE